MPALPFASKLWPRRFKHRLLLLMAGLLMLATTLLGTFTVKQQSQSAQQAMQTQAAALARSLAVASSQLIRPGKHAELDALALNYAGFEGVRALHVIAPDGLLLVQMVKPLHQAAFTNPELQAVENGARAASGPPRLSVPAQVLPSLKAAADGSHLEVWHPVVNERLLAWVKLDFDLSPLHQLQQDIWRDTVLVAVLLVGLCGLLLHALLNRPMRALEQARRFAAELADARGLTHPVDDGPIEFVELGRALNEASVLLLQQMIVLQDAMKRQQAHEAQMEEQNDQLSAIFALSPDGLLTFDQQGQVQFANRAFLSLTDLQPGDVLGQSDSVLEGLLLARAVAGEEFAGLDACFAAPDTEVGEALTLTLHGDKPRVLTLSGQHSYSASVSRVLYVCDVTRQHELDRMKSEFLSLAAHELRTPMTSIYGFIELMLEREMSEAKRQATLARVHRQCKLMINILNELLDLARIEARGASDFKFETLDLGDIVSETLADFKTPEGRERPRFELRQPGQAAMMVCIDRQKMQQILLNTLSNAYKYSPGGGPVEVRLVQGKRMADGDPLEARRHFGVEVRDHGIGLSAEHLARMGERFFRADTSGHIPGTGLGVSIVKELLDLMGGHMQIESELGQGSSITLWIKC